MAGRIIAEGTVTVESDSVTRFSFTRGPSMAISHLGNDVSRQIKNEMRQRHGAGYEGHFIVYEDSSWDLYDVEVSAE